MPSDIEVNQQRLHAFWQDVYQLQHRVQAVFDSLKQYNAPFGLGEGKRLGSLASCAAHVERTLKELNDYLAQFNQKIFEMREVFQAVAAMQDQLSPDVARQISIKIQMVNDLHRDAMRIYLRNDNFLKMHPTNPLNKDAQHTERVILLVEKLRVEIAPSSELFGGTHLQVKLTNPNPT